MEPKELKVRIPDGLSPRLKVRARSISVPVNLGLCLSNKQPQESLQEKLQDKSQESFSCIKEWVMEEKKSNTKLQQVVHRLARKVSDCYTATSSFVEDKSICLVCKSVTTYPVTSGTCDHVWCCACLHATVQERRNEGESFPVQCPFCKKAYANTSVMNFVVALPKSANNLLTMWVKKEHLTLQASSSSEDKQGNYSARPAPGYGSAQRLYMAKTVGSYGNFVDQTNVWLQAIKHRFYECKECHMLESAIQANYNDLHHALECQARFKVDFSATDDPRKRTEGFYLNGTLFVASNLLPQAVVRAYLGCLSREEREQASPYHLIIVRLIHVYLSKCSAISDKTREQGINSVVKLLKDNSLRTRYIDGQSALDVEGTECTEFNRAFPNLFVDYEKCLKSVQDASQCLYSAKPYFHDLVHRVVFLLFQMPRLFQEADVRQVISNLRQELASFCQQKQQRNKCTKICLDAPWVDPSRKLNAVHPLSQHLLRGSWDKYWLAEKAHLQIVAPLSAGKLDPIKRDELCLRGKRLISSGTESNISESSKSSESPKKILKTLKNSSNE